MTQAKRVQVIFQPSGRRGAIDAGLTLIDASRRLGADIEALCGEKKGCGKCKVRIQEGFFEKFGIHSSQANVSEWQPEEANFIDAAERREGYRLGCCARVLGDLLVYVPEESRAGKQVVSKAARNIHIDWDPAVKYYHLEVPEPTLGKPTADFERVLEELERCYGLKELSVDCLALRKLPMRLREAGNRRQMTVGVWMDREIIRLLPGRVTDYYGVAVDIGTTTVAVYFCNLCTMQVIDTVSMMNPQCKYGEDLMSRLTYHVTNPGGLEQMSCDIIAGLNRLVAKACAATHPPENNTDGGAKEGKSRNSPEQFCIADEDGMLLLAAGADKKLHPCIDVSDVVDMTIVGNTIMHHILLRLNPEYVAQAPFPAVIHKSLDVKARDLGIKINESAYVHILPNEAGFVGADNVAVLIAEEPYMTDEIQLIIDIGTNCELVLGNKERLVSTSCATGPALEGAHISFGMRAAPGAIESIKIDHETHEVDYKVIGQDAWRSFSKPEEMQAKGICGSGILDVLAELYCAGIVLKSGSFNDNQKSPRFRRNPETNQLEFVIAWWDETSIGKDIVITQKDIRQIQLAKAALYCGCKLIMRRLGVDKVDKVKIAGAFGTHVDHRKALMMGLFPDCSPAIVESVGNAAGDGARAALLNRAKRVEADWVARHVEYMELAVEKDFQQHFMEALEIPHMTDQFPHIERADCTE